MTRRQELWREHERAWLRKHAVTRMGKSNERTTDMTFPIHKVAKSIAETGTSWLTEQQLTEKIFDHAQRDRRSNETPAQAFARHFNASDEQGLALRKAVQVARVGTYHPFPR